MKKKRIFLSKNLPVSAKNEEKAKENCSNQIRENKRKNIDIYAKWQHRINCFNG